MCEKSRFFICKHCGNIIGMIKSSGVPIICCGEPMEELIANTTEASNEKHIPVVETEGNKVTVSIGSVSHPMSAEHHIAWVYLQIDSGGQRKCLKVDTEPKVSFRLCEGDTLVSAYAYCNLHGLWKVDVK
ncbi:MAG: desulfoferrodoxin family protein [Anaerovoracaceae bacterium]|jgi:superoxide reductase